MNHTHGTILIVVSAIETHRRHVGAVQFRKKNVIVN